MCIQSDSAFLLDLKAALLLDLKAALLWQFASVQADAPTEAAASAVAERVVAEIGAIEAVIVVAVVPSSGVVDAYGSADELHSLPRSSQSLHKLDMCTIPVHASADAPAEALET